MRSLLVIGIIVACCGILSGCKILKGKNTIKSDSTDVHKESGSFIDSTKSGTVTKSDISEMYDKWKTTFTYPDAKPDTNVTNVYNYPPRPSTIVIERETGQRQETKSDSSWYFNFQASMFMAIDSLNRKIDQFQKTKESETKGLGLIAVIMIALGGAIVIQLIKHGISGYTLIKKSKLNH